jgi:FkbM family methyltransferase
LAALRDADFASRVAARDAASAAGAPPPLPRGYIFVDVGANKGYLAAATVGLWLPQSGVSPVSCGAVLRALPGGRDPGCGVCQDCREELAAPAASAADVAWLATQGKVSVFAVEPQPSNFELVLGVAAAWSAAGLPGALLPCQLALSDYEGTASMEDRGRGDEGSSLGNENVANGPKYSVRVTTLDALVASDVDPAGESLLDGVFIDAEGYDPAVIDGGLESLVYARVVVFEYGSWVTTFPRMKRRKRYLSEVVDKMDFLGFTCYLTWEGALFRLTGCWAPEFEFNGWANVMCANRRDDVASRTLARFATLLD